MSKIKIFGMGGLDENGKNTYVVEVNNKIFVFDAGLKYATDNIFGIDYIIPDYKYLIENQNRIVGVFITHAHLENMGGVFDLVRNIPNIKIYVNSTKAKDIRKYNKAENEILYKRNSKFITKSIKKQKGREALSQVI